MKKHFLWMLLSLLTVTAFGQQLKHWPVYAKKSGSDVLQDMAYSTTPPQTYGVFTYPGIPPSAKVLCSNAYYNASGSLVFYVVQTDELSVGCTGMYKVYFYDASGVALPNCTSYKGCIPTGAYTVAPATTEINIIPVPNCGESLFHVIIGNTLAIIDMRPLAKKIVYQSNFSKELGINIGHGSGTKYHSPTAVWAADRSSYFVYFLAANSSGGNGDSRLHKIRISLNVCDAKRCVTDENKQNYLSYSYVIDASSIRIGDGASIIPPDPSMGFDGSVHFTGSMVSELELSADGKHLLFNDAQRIYSFNFDDPDNPNLYASLEPNMVDIFPIPLKAPAVNYQISGLEYSPDSDYIYYTMFNETVPGALPAPVDALRKINISTKVDVPITGTHMFARSQLETGLDNNIYMISENAMAYVTPAHVFTPYSPTPFTSPDKILINPGMNVPVSANFDIYTLPDQLDGQVFNSSYFNDPVILTNNIVFCGQDLLLQPRLACGNATEQQEEFRNNVKWYKCPVTAMPGEPGCVFLTEHYAYDVPSSDLQNAPVKYVAEYTDLYGCVKREVFIITLPTYTTEVVNIKLCYGETAPSIWPCPGNYTRWYEGDVDAHSAGPGEDLWEVLPSPVTAGKTITALCKNANGCVTKKTVYHIQVSPEPIVSGLTVQVCDGAWFDPNIYKPAGWNTPDTYPPGVYTSSMLDFKRYDANHCLLETFELYIDVQPVTETEQTITVNCGTIIDFSYYNCSPNGPSNKWYKADLIDPSGRVPFIAGYTIITQPGTYFCEGTDPCCRFTLHINVDPLFLNSSKEFCYGETVNLLDYVPAEYHPAEAIAPVVVTGNQTYTFISVSFLGCTTYYHLNVSAISYETQHLYIEVDCGTLIDLNGYNCSTTGPNQWYKDDPYVFGGKIPISSLIAAIPMLQSGTYYCEGKNPCCGLVLHVTVRPPLAEAANLFVCEGDLIDFSSFTGGCHHTNQNTPILATTSQQYAVECYSENGCLLKVTTVHVMVRPKQIHSQNILVNCGDSYTLPAISPECGAPVDWFTRDIAGTPIPVPSNTFYVGESKTYYGYNAEFCCSLEYHIFMMPALPETYYICNVSGMPLPNNICPNGTTSVWTKDGLPHTTGTFDANLATYRVQCIDNNTNCVKSDITFVVGEWRCDFTFICYEPGMTLPSPCPEGTTAVWMKNNQPYPSNPDGSATPDGRGHYVVDCKDANGISIMSKMYFVYPCGEGVVTTFGKTGSTAVKENSTRDKQSLLVYPNPTNGNFTVEFNIPDATSIEITDMLGRVVYTQALSAGDSKISVNSNDWNTGMYMVRVRTQNNSIQTTRLLKSK